MRKRIQISPSLLDSFLYLRNFEWSTVESFREKIQRKFEPTMPISKGRAYHELIEHGPDRFMVHTPLIDGDLDGSTAEPARDNAPLMQSCYEVHDPEMDYTWTFSEDQVIPARTIRENFPGMTYESWNSFEIHLPNYDVRCLMKHDGLWVNELHEFKTTGSQKKWIDYYFSPQWKCYLMALPDVETVWYHVIRFLKSRTDYNVFEYRRYDGMENDMKMLFQDLVHWLELHDPELLTYLEIDRDGKRVRQPDKDLAPVVDPATLQRSFAS